MAQVITIEKGQYLVLQVTGMEELPSKNPTWDSRWAITGYTLGGEEVKTYVGNKGMTQQMKRRNLTVDDVIGATWGFERTAEGYFNLLSEKDKVKPGSVPVEGTDAKPKAQKPKAEARSHGHIEGLDDEPLPPEPEDEFGEEGDSKHVPTPRERFLTHLSEDIHWATATATDIVTSVLAEKEVPFGPEALRSVVALSSTIFIAMKGGPK